MLPESLEAKAISAQYSFEHHEDYSDLFTDEAAAVYALYEQLFDSLNSVCDQTILDAVKYLVGKNNMNKQEEEMANMTSNDVCVVHYRQLDKVEERTTQEIKNKIYKVLEEEI